MKRSPLAVSLILALFVSSIFGAEFANVAGAEFSTTPTVTDSPSPFTGEIRITADGAVEGTDKISRVDNVYSLVGDLSGSVKDGFVFTVNEY